MSLESVSPAPVEEYCGAGAGSEQVASRHDAGEPRPLASATNVEFHVPTVEVFGLPLATLTVRETLEKVDQLIMRRQPSFFITANLNYAMLSDRQAELLELNRQAAFLTADGMPLIWGAKFKGVELPGRVTGADLTPLLFELAAERGYPAFILGAADAVARKAAQELQLRYPALKIVGTESPDLRLLSPSEEAELVKRIRESEPRLIVVAFGQPKGELWIARHHQSLGNAVCVQVGAAIDFLAGNVQRAPIWMQQLGLEWLYRVLLEPRRLIGRYADNLRYLGRSAACGLPGAVKTWWRNATSRTNRSR